MEPWNLHPTQRSLILKCYLKPRLGSLRSLQSAAMTPDEYGNCRSPPTPAVLADRMQGFAQPLAPQAGGSGRSGGGSVGRYNTYGNYPSSSMQGPETMQGFPYRERVLRHYDKTYRSPDVQQQRPSREIPGRQTPRGTFTLTHEALGSIVPFTSSSYIICNAHDIVTC